MKLLNKSIEPTVKEALLSLKVNCQCLQFPAEKRHYIRLVIARIKKENSTYNYKTKTKKDSFYVWRKDPNTKSK
ncbi:hypothetical protein [Sphingobacterium bovisgrunnientis]|uniref:hypothetical protein n=1 Tax=Sphingobacterium bovisgrunnientis TaxID=1874697 RepID=UPI00135A7ED3|nr:hypothetical protein [Sphingobacterium bovisgrunnientis]